MAAVRAGGDGDPAVTIYADGEAGGVMILVIAGVISIMAIAVVTAYYLFFAKHTKTYHRTHIAPYLVSLLLANVLQAVGTIMNARWVSYGRVIEDGFCALQGGIKNAANVGTAIWSFTIAAHVFNLLFLRWTTTRAGLVVTLVGGWSTVALIVVLGPTVIVDPLKGPYFGVSGYWCWITDNYPKEQTFLEYFFEFLSAGLGFVLYVLVLLRVRGYLSTDARDSWRLRWVARKDAWKLSVGRDMLDEAMLKVAANMVWYPVAYSIIIIPIALARLSAFDGHHVPFWATITTDAIFNLTGLVNSILLLSTRSVLPDTSTLPSFATPRRNWSTDAQVAGPTSPQTLKSKALVEVAGVTPYVLPPVSALERENVERWNRIRGLGRPGLGGTRTGNGHGRAWSDSAALGAGAQARRAAGGDVARRVERMAARAGGKGTLPHGRTAEASFESFGSRAALL